MSRAVSVRRKPEGRRRAEADGLPVLARLCDALLLGDPESDEILFIFKIFCGSHWEPGLDRMIAAIRGGFQKDAYWWRTAFGALAQKDGPGLRMVLDALRDPLPQGLCREIFLDCANTAAREHGVLPHAFDTTEGRRLLGRWLASTDPEDFGSAHSAAAALPYVAAPDRADLLSLAMRHADPGVRMEGAWAAAELGDESGIALLARACEDVRHALVARNLLAELGRADAVPEAAKSPDFEAMAEMAVWLAYPTEFGRPVDHIELVDTRELFWPPTGDRRRVWLFKYVYESREEGESEHVGLGMVGSVTFAYDEVTADLAPEDAYGLHCCWELEMNRDPRAPKTRSAAEGRRILEAHQG